MAKRRSSKDAWRAAKALLRPPRASLSRALAASRDPRLVRAGMHLGFRRIHEAGLRLAEEALAGGAFEESDEALVWKAICLHQTGDPAGCLAVVDEKLPGQGDFILGDGEYARTLHAAGRSEEALDYLDRTAARGGGRRVPLLRLRRDLLLELGRDPGDPVEEEGSRRPRPSSGGEARRWLLPVLFVLVAIPLVELVGAGRPVLLWTLRAVAGLAGGLFLGSAAWGGRERRGLRNRLLRSRTLRRASAEDREAVLGRMGLGQGGDVSCYDTLASAGPPLPFPP